MKALVEFVGAGPGAEDLITVRGPERSGTGGLGGLRGVAGQPCPPQGLQADCTCLDSASMNLGNRSTAMSDAALAGKRVVRLHTGDPAMYGAINEQIRGLAQKAWPHPSSRASAACSRQQRRSAANSPAPM